MSEQEVILVDTIPSDAYHKIALNAARYALISVAFTFNRMDKKHLLDRVINITKGNIAEGLFYYFCKENNIGINTEPCTTPFWLPDQKDFIYLNGEWDIKNNFMYYKNGHNISAKNMDLPALIPNKYEGDQWTKRNETYFENTRFSAYLFTFMPLRKEQKDFFEIILNHEQAAFISTIAQRYSRHPYGEMPFLESWFYQKINAIGPEMEIRLKYYPPLIITGCANARYWSLFKDTGPMETQNHYHDYLPRGWYTNEQDKITNFMNGTIVTTIKNKTCPIVLLPSFSMLHPHLLDELKFAKWHNN